MKVTAAAILWIALSLVATSCGGTSSADATRGSEHSDASSMLLVRGDFPSGWKALADEQYAAAEKRFRECITPATSALTVIGGADRIFYSKNGSASSGGTVFGSAEQASDALRGIKDNVERCYGELFARNLVIEGHDPSSPSVGKVRARELDAAAQPDIDETIEWQIATPVTLAPGLTVNNNTDLVTLRDGDAIAIVTTDNGVAPFDAGLRDQLLEKLARRLSSND